MINSLLNCKKRLKIDASINSILEHLEISLSEVEWWNLQYYRPNTGNNFTLLRSFFAWNSKKYQKIDKFMKSGMVLK